MLTLRFRLLFESNTPFILFSPLRKRLFSKCYHISSLVEQVETCTNLLRECAKTSDLPHGRAIHAKFIKGSIPVSLFLQNHLINVFLKCGDLSNGLQLFEEMPEKNVVSWSAVIAGLVQHGYPEKALLLFRQMQRNGTVKPNEFTLVSALHAFSLLDDLAQAYQIYALIVRLGFESNIYLVNAFISVLIRHSRLKEAFEVFESFLGKDIVSWNAVIHGYSQFSCSELPRFWFRMNHEGVRPDNYTFATVLTGLAALYDINMGKQVHGKLVKCGHGAEMCVGNSLLEMYAKNQRLDDAFRAFEEMPLRDVCSWTQMAAGCLHFGEPRTALNVIFQMRKVGLKPNKFTLATALNACANLVSLDEGKKFHGLRVKLGTEIDVCIDNALLDMYAKCGCMDGACDVFQFMDDRSVISWTTMVMACAQNGQAREALEIFDNMTIEGVEPNYITFVCVLYACSQGGFVDKGWEYFISMTRDHGISPGEDHYACMVNLLGRAGHTKEAEELILKMPFQPGVLIWKTLLGSCQTHGDSETAKRAAKFALDLDVTDPSTYVLLSNVFAGFSNWNGVTMLRELMKSRDVKKMPGSSWVEVEKYRSGFASLEGLA